MTRASVSVVFAAVLLGGCSGLPTATQLTRDPLPVRQGAGAVELHDGRARFRQIFCAVLASAPASDSAYRSCDARLWRLADEPGPSATNATLPDIDPRLHMVLITGAFGDCFGAASLPWPEVPPAIKASGARVETIVVEGLSGSARNAGLIAQRIAAMPLETADRLVLIGYSKGAVDALEFLVAHPELSTRVAALVSLAGPVWGTPLADDAAWADLAVAHAPFMDCAPGDGKMLHSLKTVTRSQWFAAQALPANVSYYSIAAFATEERVAYALRAPWHILSGKGVRNDGQVPLESAFIPGATVLALANADHWEVAMQLESARPHLAARRAKDGFPRAALFEALARYLSEDLCGGC